MRNTLLTALAALSLAPAAQAATATFTVATNPTNSTFSVSLTDSTGDNFGIASYGFALSGFTTLVNTSPFARFNDTDGNQVAEVGFSEIRTGDNINPSGAGQALANASGNAIYVFRIGQPFTDPKDGNLSNYQPTGSVRVTPSARTTYAPSVVVATGTYTGVAPTITQRQVLVFTSMPANNALPSTTDAQTSVVYTPEPAVLGLAGLTVLGLVRRRRA